MSQLQSFSAIFSARTLEFVRDKGAFFWTLFFPILMIIAFIFLFGNQQSTVFSIGTIGTVPQNASFLEISGIGHTDYSEKGDSEEVALEQLRKHQVGLLINFETGQYYINSEAANIELLRAFVTRFIFDNSGKSISELYGLSESQVTGKAIRYTDWIVPGIIGMNMMFSCLFGVGYVLVRYRKNGVLKRMKATPVSAFTFLTAQSISRFVIVIVTSIVIYFGTNLFFKFEMAGNWFNLLLVTALGILSMISFGLIFAARIKNEELAGGLINIVTWPMLILSGIFFSLDNVPPAMRTIGNIFPLSHFISATRAIMLEGAGLGQILPELLYLIIFTLVFLVLLSLLFKWE